MYPVAIRDRFLINEPTLQGLAHLGQSSSDQVTTTIDTLAKDAASVIQAGSAPSQVPWYGGGPLYPAATSTGLGVGALLLLGLGVFVLVRMSR